MLNLKRIFSAAGKNIFSSWKEYFQQLERIFSAAGKNIFSSWKEE
jgi:hypothetical protein